MQVSLKYAEEHFADLISAVNRGEEVEIAQAEKPSIRLVASRPARRSQGAERILGAGVGEMIVPTGEEWRKMKEDTVSLMNDGPISSSKKLAQVSEGSNWRNPESPRSELFGCLKGKLVISEDLDSPETSQAIADLFEAGLETA